MSTLIERARNRRPITWLTLIGVLLLPALIGGVLVVSLYNPVDRLDNMTAAIVNNDEPVTLNDQTVPLGRQLTAGLVEGSDDLESNLDWTITNDEDAAAGLADGTYAAVITIPKNFSAAATSTAGDNPEQATIDVVTAPDALIVDEAITAQVAQTATSLLGQQLSETYLENVFLGFTTLNEQLGEAASGADDLTDGAEQAADGAAQLPDAATQLGDGAQSLSSGAGALSSGLGDIAGGISSAADGTNQLANGLSSSASTLANNELPGAAQTMQGYINDSASQTAGVAQSVGGVAQDAGALAKELGSLASTCLADGGSPAVCDRVAAAATSAGGIAQKAGGAAQSAVDAATSAGTAKGYADEVVPGISQLVTQTSAGLSEAASQTTQLAGGLSQLASGASQSQSGAQQLQSGATQLADGAFALSDGAQSLADGVAQLADGSDQLASGLHTAVEQIPTYTDDEATALADVVADPVAAEGVGSNLFGASAIPLLSALALWFGGLASFIALQAVSRRALVSRRSSAALALRSFAPAAALGAGQGFLVAAVVQLAASYAWGEWSLFALLCVAVGIAFAAINQALVAVFGGIGRWLSAIIGVLALATGVVSTVPPLLTQIANYMPTAPAYNAMLGALTSAGGITAGVVGLAAWALLALIATIIATAQRRKTSAHGVAEASLA
ncbi:putative membrane protein [Microbacterium endophyticum]|uniref:Putative membrane protein n=1 Tax=Microbacterium endophyticum TaxID=1526412 RepID=A0A7W4V5N6_9MICO|nr:YhgE/Pip domain-containing protein [Microbacterium endophyticum]MBB2976683.1 putative membrane protein [Microbacterium endophyticum]NIK37644.1 putative membrane protein [Microbacterium endophyticum]